ncbi:hypothetical protein SCHPADRAFT_1003282 [Schizopora paradoxa]|uniref:MYND-type domain-containing protein n=1 Tax=Schizopora paradoxa TaxID=27342 RepID=A0A0H2QYN9_9AGAM|nr:hypothetical protein SCHPADRAFT_1003282 [Schizopora paradoxa]
MHPLRFAIEGHGVEKQARDFSIAVKAVSQNPSQVLRMAKTGSILYRNRLINGIDGLPHELRPDATLFILKALQKEGGKTPAHSVSSLVQNVIPFITALHKMKSLGRDMPSPNMQQLFDIWPTCFKWCRQVTDAILDNRSDCPSTELMLYFILLVIHMFAGWKGLSRNPTASNEFRRLAISLWLHSYDSTEAQHDATEVMVHNFTSHNIRTTNGHHGVGVDVFRLSIQEIAKEMRLNEENIMKMALKRLVRASQRATRFRSETFHTDYHLTALSMLINEGGSTAAIASKFLSAFEEARGPLIVTNLLGIAVKNQTDGIFLDHFVISGLTTLACSFRSSSMIMIAMREIMRPELFDLLVKATLRLPANSSQSSPIDAERWSLQRSLIQDILYHRISPILLFRSTMNAMTDILPRIFGSGAFLTLVKADVGWETLFRIYNLDIKPHEYLEGQGNPDVHRCANLQCSVTAAKSKSEATRTQVFSCAVCQFATYCSKECQLVDWRLLGHRDECSKCKKSLERTGLSALDAKALACRAYHHVTGQMALLDHQKSIGVLVDFTTEIKLGALGMETFLNIPPDDELLPIFPAVHSKGTTLKRVPTLAIKVKYLLFDKATSFAFIAPFDEGVMDGTKCSCSPYPTSFQSICKKHNIYPKAVTLRKEEEV